MILDSRQIMLTSRQMIIDTRQIILDSRRGGGPRKYTRIPYIFVDKERVLEFLEANWSVNIFQKKALHL